MVLPFFVRAQQWWLMVLLVALPVSLRYIVEQPVAVSWLTITSGVFIALGVLNVVTQALSLKKVTPRSFMIITAGLLLAMAYALLFTDPLRNGLGLWTSRLLQPLLVGYFVYQLLQAKIVTVEACARALLVSLIPLAIVALLQVGGVIPYKDVGRVSALYPSSNGLARYCSVVLLVSLPWLFMTKDRLKYGYGGLWILGLGLLLSSKSYGSSFALFGGLVVMFAALPGKAWGTIKRGGLIMLAIVAILAAVNAPRLPKWETTITASKDSRLEFWGVARGVIRDHFWTGIGIKTWETQYVSLIEKYGSIPPLNWRSDQPHNVYLDGFIKAGLPGFLAILALIAWPIVTGWQVVRTAALHKETSDLWWFGLSMLGYGTSLALLGLIDDPLWSDDTALLLWVLFFSLAFTATRVLKVSSVHE